MANSRCSIAKQPVHLAHITTSYMFGVFRRKYVQTSTARFLARYPPTEHRYIDGAFLGISYPPTEHRHFDDTVIVNEDFIITYKFRIFLEMCGILYDLVLLYFGLQHIRTV